MAKFSGPDDIYKNLVEDSQENWLYGLVAFAILEEQRVEWVRHFEEHKGVPPSREEVTAWYEHQPENALLRAKGAAENALMVYAEEVVEVIKEDQLREIEEGVIVNEIRDLKAFWPQFCVNLAGGLASALLFGLFLITIWFFLLKDISPVSLASSVEQKIEVGENANNRSN